MAKECREQSHLGGYVRKRSQAAEYHFEEHCGGLDMLSGAHVPVGSHVPS